MRKVSSCVALMVVFVLVSAWVHLASAAEITRVSPVLDRILAKKELVVGTAADLPPLNMTTKEGQIIGVEADLAFLFTPDWEDFVCVGVNEIRLYGANSIQVMRRLRAMLEDLIDALPSHRSPPLREQLELVGRSVERNFPDPEDRKMAGVADYKGIGGSRLGRVSGTASEK